MTPTTSFDTTRRGMGADAAARRGIWPRLLSTNDSLAPLVLRLTLALVMFPHGAQKALGWFGGEGLSDTIDYFTGAPGLPLVIVLLVVAAEFLGPIALAAGALTRVAAFGVGAVMVGAVATVHQSFGFFMNWSGTKAGEGFEYHLLAIGIALALIVAGGGKWSVDGRVRRLLTSQGLRP